MATYTIPASMRKDVCKKISSIVHKCVVNHIPYVYEEGQSYEKEVEDKDNHCKYSVSVFDLTVDVKFIYNGWRSLGMISRKDGVLQYFVDDSSLIDLYPNPTFQCEHCHKKAHRNSVVILENESGERKVVGTSCVKMFTRGLDGSIIASYHEYLLYLQEQDGLLKSPSEVWCHSFGSPSFSVEEVVSAASRCISENGFVPSGYSDSTCNLLHFYMRKEVDDEVIKALNWIRSLTEDQVKVTPYLFNIHQIVMNGFCTSRHFGFLASLIPAYKKEERRRIEEAEREKEALTEQERKARSQYVGNVGDKPTLSLKFLKRVSFEYEVSYSRYPQTSFIYLFSDESGNTYKWTTSTYYGWGDGDSITLKGTIKAHEEYKGEKQTVLTRCKQVLPLI